VVMEPGRVAGEPQRRLDILRAFEITHPDAPPALRLGETNAAYPCGRPGGRIAVRLSARRRSPGTLALAARDTLAAESSALTAAPR
jgi:hypothetical protein